MRLVRPPKKPKAVEKPKPVKIPKWQDDSIIDGAKPLSWRFSHRDPGGPFGWQDITSEDLHGVITRFAEFEGMNWDQIKVAGSHPIECARFCDAARARLVEIGHDDLDEMMSFRVMGAWRVWCVHDGSIMRVLWWDPDHQVYPTPVDKADRQKHSGRKK